MTSASGDGPRHYSYAHYADRQVAEGFDALRFSGPIGRHVLEAQQAILLSALAPVATRTVIDVGTGTGRAAIALALSGATVVGVDASAEMLDVARARAAEAHVTPRFEVADAHHLSFADGSFDAVVCLRLLMHVPDWRKCVAELCRVARWRVVLDFPAALSFAALESGGRRLASSLGRRTEPYRVLRERDVERALRAGGLSVSSIDRQFVLPIALHKTVNSIALTRALERGLAGVGLARLAGSPVTMVAER